MTPHPEGDRLRQLLIQRLEDEGCIGDDEQGCTRDDDIIPYERWCVNCLAGRLLTLVREPLAASLRAHRWVGGGDYGDPTHGQMCGDCGVDAGDDDAQKPCPASLRAVEPTENDILQHFDAASPVESRLDQSEDESVVNAVTAAMREADRAFEKVGGSTRHHVRDCLLPVLNRDGFFVTRVSDPADWDRELYRIQADYIEKQRVEITALKAELEALRGPALAAEGRAWQPIETLQSDPAQSGSSDPAKVNCLVSDGEQVWEAWYDVQRDEFYEPNAEHGDEYERQLFPTHWMPLPLPPVPAPEET